MIMCTTSLHTTYYMLCSGCRNERVLCFLLPTRPVRSGVSFFGRPYSGNYDCGLNLVVWLTAWAFCPPSSSLIPTLACIYVWGAKVLVVNRYFIGRCLDAQIQPFTPWNLQMRNSKSQNTKSHNSFWGICSVTNIGILSQHNKITS